MKLGCRFASLRLTVESAWCRHLSKRIEALSRGLRSLLSRCWSIGPHARVFNFQWPTVLTITLLTTSSSGAALDRLLLLRLVRGSARLRPGPVLLRPLLGESTVVVHLWIDVRRFCRCTVEATATSVEVVIVILSRLEATLEVIIVASLLVRLTLIPIEALMALVETTLARLLGLLGMSSLVVVSLATPVVTVSVAAVGIEVF